MCELTRPYIVQKELTPSTGLFDNKEFDEKVFLHFQRTFRDCYFSSFL